jgi:predicted RNA-binding Zn ribbon-like protein
MSQTEIHTSEQQQKQEQGTTSDYLFLSGVLALDLVNTEIVVRGKKRDLLSSPQNLASWWQEALSHHRDSNAVKEEANLIEFNAELLEATKKLRTALRNLFTSLVQQQPVNEKDLEELNQVLKMGYRSLEITSGGVLSLFQQTTDWKGAILLPIALSAIRLITESDRDRLHKCKNDRCVLFFYDTTKSATRQWCSLGCMNRARSIAHYRRAKV